jgi:heat shock protein HslJ
MRRRAFHRVARSAANAARNLLPALARASRAEYATLTPFERKSRRKEPMSNPSIARRAASPVRPSPGRAGALAAAPFVAVCAMLAACAMPTHPESAAPPSDPFNPAATQLLDDTSWTLASWQTAGGATRQIASAEGAEGAKDATGGEREAAPTLVLSTVTGQRRASGFAGCNRFSGPYALKSGELTLGPLATTRMACSGSRGELEHAYLDALAHIAKTGVQWRTPHRLELVTEDGAILRFDAASR